MAPRSDGASSAAFPATDDSASANDRDVFRLFAYLWAAAVLFHIGSFDLWSQSWLEVLAAFWVLTRPGSTFHKLNADWFDPSVSCGAIFYAREREVFPFLPASPALAALSIHASLGFEMAIPLLLVFRSTRHLGILAGMLFHWILATNPLSGFYWPLRSWSSGRSTAA